MQNVDEVQVAHESAEVSRRDAMYTAIWDGISNVDGHILIYPNENGTTVPLYSGAGSLSAWPEKDGYFWLFVEPHGGKAWPSTFRDEQEYRFVLTTGEMVITGIADCQDADEGYLNVNSFEVTIRFDGANYVGS